MDGIIDQVRRMPLAEKRRLAEALRQAIAEELASGGGEPDRCPRCGCPAFVRKGRDAAGRQRWLCRGCGRTFGAGTLGLLARSKLPAAAWMEFAACMVLALPQNQPNAPLYPAGGAPGSRPGALPHFGRPRYLGPPPRARSTAG